MSSIYSPNNGIPLCQRCNIPLADTTLRCANCGYYNTVLPGSGTQQPNQQSPAQNQFPGQPIYHEQPSNQPQQRQNGGLLKRYPAQVEQRNRYPSPSPQSQAAPQPFSPQLPVNGMSSQVRQQPEITPPTHIPQISGNRSGYTDQSSMASLNRGYLPNNAQPISPISIGPTMPPTSLNSSFNHVPPSAYTHVSPPLNKEPVKSRQLNVGRTVGVLLLLLVLVGGSFLAYTFLFAHKNTQAVTRSSPSHSSTSTTSSVPQGTPLFQDSFIQNTNGWSIQSYPGEFSVTLGNGSLKLENDSNKLLWELIPGAKTYADFQLSVDAVLSKGSQDNGYGVYIRGTLSQNTSITSFYRFELYGDGSFAVFKGATDANGAVMTSRLVDYTNSSSIQKQGSLNHIMIIAKGANLQFIINGQTVSTVSDTTYTNGSVALFVSNLQNASPGAEATFSHLAIYPVLK